MVDYRGARGSNAGDDFHELWALRQVLTLLDEDTELKVVTLEGLRAEDEQGTSSDTWDGVDCAFYFGGNDLNSADRIIIDQLKYSAAHSDREWTIARLTSSSNKKKNNSVIGRLAQAFMGLKDKRADLVQSGKIALRLISNQKIDPAVLDALSSQSAEFTSSNGHSGYQSNRSALLAASNLQGGDFEVFTKCLDFSACGGESRFGLEERILITVSEWTDDDARTPVTDLLRFVRRKMMPEAKGEWITRQSILAQLGFSDPRALFPCPSAIRRVEQLISRTVSRAVAERMLSGDQCICLHGEGGSGKTTAVQEIQALLPAGSVMIVFDCYGGGRYLDSDSYRHRPQDAFLQLCNDLARQTRIPLLVSRSASLDYPRVFKKRLERAAEVVASTAHNALLVVVIDAADNSITAANTQSPPERSFIYDFASLGNLPANVRFLVTARTGRLPSLALPHGFTLIPIEGFTRQETAAHVQSTWSEALDIWVDDFHQLSGGNPRVQRYALDYAGAEPRQALDYLRPNGKGLHQIFQEQLKHARYKIGLDQDIKAFSAGLIALPRPIPLTDLSTVTGLNEAQLRDLSADLAPGVRLTNRLLSFADEDFEYFIRIEAQEQLSSARDRAADHFVNRHQSDAYAAAHIATALFTAGRRREIIDLINTEPEPTAIVDPILRREVQLRRLQTAMKVCRETGNSVDAMLTLLIGADALKTNAAIRRTLVKNPDLTAAFARGTSASAILRDSNEIENHGPLLFHLMATDARAGEAISVREGHRQIQAWMQRRSESFEEQKRRHPRISPQGWDISYSDIAAETEAFLRVVGPRQAVEYLLRWKPKPIALQVAVSLSFSLIASGSIHLVEQCIAEFCVPSPWDVFLLTPLALAGKKVDLSRIEIGLSTLLRRRLIRPEKLRDAWREDNATSQYLDVIVTACELIVARGGNIDCVSPILELIASPERRQCNHLHVSDIDTLDLCLRSHSLLECLAQRDASLDTFLIDPPPPNEELSPAKHAQQQRANSEKKDEIRSFISPIFDTYVTRAQIITSSVTSSEASSRLQKAVVGYKNDDYRTRNQLYAPAMRLRAVLSITRLMVAPIISRSELWTYISEFISIRSDSFGSAESSILASLSLDVSLHSEILHAVMSRAKTTKDLRISADDKIDILTRLSRVLLPISPSDAEILFNDAIGVAVELNYEAIHEIALFEPLAKRAIEGLDVSTRRSVARDVATIVNDAGIRLSGYDHFPWTKAARALSTLDFCFSLATVARWEDTSLIKRDTTLPPVLETALSSNALTPIQVAAFSPLLDELTVGFVDQMIEKVYQRKSGHNLEGLTEHLAQEELLRFGQGTRQEICTKLTSVLEQTHQGYWLTQLVKATAFHGIRRLNPAASANTQTSSNWRSAEAVDRSDPFADVSWHEYQFVNKEEIEDVVGKVHESARAANTFIANSLIFERIGAFIALRNRIAYLEALSRCEFRSISDLELMQAIVSHVEAWQNSPAVNQWYRDRFLRLVFERLPLFVRWITFGQSPLQGLLDTSGLNQSQIVSALLESVERHVDEFDAATVIALVGLIVQYCSSDDAGQVITRYANRLVQRIPTPDREQWNLNDIPNEADSGAARFLYALMSDVDVRIRWRAAHTLRRLARLGESRIIDKTVELYDLTSEPTYRRPDAPFYWLASRLWLVIGLDRIARETPSLIQHHGKWLFDIAQNESFPHILIRFFAKSAAHHLVENGHLTLDDSQRDALNRANTSLVRRKKAKRSQNRDLDNYYHRNYKDRRFDFDRMSTLPYWYAPALKIFATTNEEDFLAVAEHWIVDHWGVANLSQWDDELRKNRNTQEAQMAMDHRHGSLPVVESFHTYLEWHAMFCTVGELMRTHALAKSGEDNYDTFEGWLRSYILASPPIWLSDVRNMKPLEDRLWYSPQEDINIWVERIKNEDFLLELGLTDDNRMLIIGTYHDTRSQAFRQEVRVKTALVSPETAQALVRALQSVDDPWDYKIPSAGDELLDTPPYQLMGWLVDVEHNLGIDERDPFRYKIRAVEQAPSDKTKAALGIEFLYADTAKWVNRSSQEVVFIYEAWGDNREDEREESLRYSDSVRSHGWRLQIDRSALSKYLKKVKLDLIVEVEITRRKNGYEYSYNDQEKSQEARYDKILLFRRDGTFEDVDGYFGSWAPPRS
jgi:hypothetical protein